MSNITLAPGMEIETDLVDLNRIQRGDHVVLDDLIYQVIKDGPAPEGVPVWSRKTDHAVSGRQVEIAYITGSFASKHHVITVVR